MALNSRRNASGAPGMMAWPGYVDALSTLLMVIIFVLLVFVLAQGFLSFALTGRSKELDSVSQKLAEVGKMLSLEKTHATSLAGTVAQLTSALATSENNRQVLTTRITGLTTQLGAAQQTAKASGARATDLGTKLADAQQRLADMQRAAKELDRTVQADRATIAAKVSDVATLDEQVRALSALRDQLELQAQNAAARAMTEKDRRLAVATQLAGEQKLGDSAKAQIVLLNQQVDQLKAQLGAVAKALDIEKSSGQEKDVKIANLGQQLNVALAAKVQELQQYRSDFFGTLRKVLAGEPGIDVVGDRFVMQSDVLFPLNSADLSADGVVQMNKIAQTVKHIADKIPPGISWVLDVDGYADSQPITSGKFASNWDLSAARAISVVNLLIANGVPADHLSATGFGDNHPLDPSDTPSGYAKNRRIELRLTDYNQSRS